MGVAVLLMMILPSLSALWTPDLVHAWIIFCFISQVNFTSSQINSLLTMSIAKLERQPVLPVENCNPRNAGIAGSALSSRLHVCLFLVTVTIIMMSSRGSLALVILLLMPLIGESIVWRSWALSGSSLGQWVLVQSS